MQDGPDVEVPVVAHDEPTVSAKKFPVLWVDLEGMARRQLNFHDSTRMRSTARWVARDLAFSSMYRAGWIRFRMRSAAEYSRFSVTYAWRAGKVRLCLVWPRVRKRDR